MTKPKRFSEIEGSSERSIQMAFFSFCSFAMVHGFDAAFAFDETGVMPKPRSDFAVPDLRWIHSIPNGAAFGGADDKQRAFRGAMMKMEGLRPGISDVFLPVASCGRHGLYIEFKNDSGSLRPAQSDFIAYARSKGFAVVICRSWKAAARVVRFYIEGDHDQMSKV
jgi:hypothetical protein